MRCTSSDLIIVLPPPVSTRSRRSAGPLIRARRVPKRQKTVKVEAVERAHGFPIFQAASEGTQPHRFERSNRRRMQERKVAKPVTQLEVAHRCLGIDLLFLGKPRHRRLLVAKLVNEVQRHALTSV